MRYSSASITVYYWRVSLCPRSIHPLVVLLYSFASVVVGNFLRMKSIVAIVAWSICHFNQTILSLKRPLTCPGGLLRPPHLLAQANLEDNRGCSYQLNHPQIAPTAIFRYLNRHSAIRLVSIRQERMHPIGRLANNLVQTIFTGPLYNNSLFILNPPNSQQQVDFNQAI